MQNQAFKTPSKNSEINTTQITFPKKISTIKLITEKIKILSKYITELFPEISEDKQEKINTCFNKIFSFLNNLSSEKKNMISKYDSILKLSEEKIRVLYSDIFNLKIKNTFLENNIDILLKKEHEYRLVKEKTGILVENGVIIHNDRKENEIFILRTENSNLKNVIKEKESQISELNDKLIKDKNIYEKKISQLNHKIEQLRYKIRTKYHKINGHSFSSNNFNTNDIITINNSLNKGNVNKIIINGIINNNNNNTRYESCFNNNMNLIKRKYDSILFNKKRNLEKLLINSESNYIPLIHCQSMGYINLKSKNNKSKERCKSTNKTFNLSKNQHRNQNSQQNIELSDIKLSPIKNKKLLCFNHKNDESVNKINFEPLYKAQSKNNSKSKKKSKKTLIKKNNIISIVNNNNFSNKKLIKLNNTGSTKGIKVIYNSKSKLKYINKKSEIQNNTKKLLKDIIWSHNNSLNNSKIPKSITYMSKSKINEKRSYSKKLVDEKNNENNKDIKRNLITNISGKENISINDKSNISSIRRKNTINSSNNSCYGKNMLNL